MSQLAKAILATDTNQRREILPKLSPLFLDTFDGKSTIQELTHRADIQYQYRIEARIGASCWVSRLEMARDNNPLTHAINRTKQQVIEAVFGEFRQDIRMIEQAVWNHDTETAGKLLNDLERKMFSQE